MNRAKEFGSFEPIRENKNLISDFEINPEIPEIDFDEENKFKSFQIDGESYIPERGRKYQTEGP